MEEDETEFDCFKKKHKSNPEILIQKMTQDSIIVSTPSGEAEIEVPRIFQKQKLFETVIICLYDTNVTGDDYESGCKFIRKTASFSTHVVTKGISDAVDFDFLSDPEAMKKLSSNTMYVIYNGHSPQDHIHSLPYREFAKKLNITFDQTDNAFILSNTCYGGGFADLIEEGTNETGNIWPAKTRMYVSTSGGRNLHHSNE